MTTLTHNVNVNSVKTLYFNTEESALFNSLTCQYTIPSQLLSYAPEDNIRLTLNSFFMYRSFYQINPNNSIFFFLDNQNKLYKIQIPSGDYNDILDTQTNPNDNFVTRLKKAIEDCFSSLDTPLTTTVAITTDQYLKSFSFVFTNGQSPNNPLANGNFYSFSVNNPGLAQGVLQTQLNRFTTIDIDNDSSDLLGSAVNRDKDIQNEVNFSKLFPMFKKINDTTYQTYFPCREDGNTLNQLFLRTNSLSHMNLESPTLSVGKTTDLASMLTSDILGVISIDDITNNTFSFEDADNNFSVIISPSALNQLQFVLTDSKGRLLPNIQTDSGTGLVISQSRMGNNYFEFSVKLEVVSKN